MSHTHPGKDIQVRLGLEERLCLSLWAAYGRGRRKNGFQAFIPKEGCGSPGFTGHIRAMREAHPLVFHEAGKLHHLSQAGPTAVPAGFHESRSGEEVTSPPLGIEIFEFRKVAPHGARVGGGFQNATATEKTFTIRTSDGHPGPPRLEVLKGPGPWRYRVLDLSIRALSKYHPRFDCAGAEPPFQDAFG
jgi:hypothetical protein